MYLSPRAKLSAVPTNGAEQGVASKVAKTPDRKSLIRPFLHDQ